jgi:hypothetical protein
MTFVFTRLLDKELTKRSFVEALTGQYELPGSPTPLTISLRGDHALVVSFPGAPDLELLPKRATPFDVKDQSGVTIEFKRDASGKVSEAAFNVNGTAVLKKK